MERKAEQIKKTTKKASVDGEKRRQTAGDRCLHNGFKDKPGILLDIYKAYESLCDLSNP